MDKIRQLQDMINESNRIVFFGGAGIDHDAEAGVGQEVDDQVVDHAAGFVEHGGVERLAGDGELGDIVGDQAGQIGRAHV